MFLVIFYISMSKIFLGSSTFVYVERVFTSQPRMIFDRKFKSLSSNVGSSRQLQIGFFHRRINPYLESDVLSVVFLFVGRSAMLE